MFSFMCYNIRVIVVIILHKYIIHGKGILMNKYQRHIYWLITGVIFVGALVPFCAQFLLPFFNKDAFVEGAEVWNQFVSIVLGIVATILSIVSLKMCFDSAESFKNAEKQTAVIWAKIKGKLDLVSQKQDYIYSTVSQNQPNTQRKTIVGDENRWKPSEKNTKTNMIVDEEV